MNKTVKIGIVASFLIVIFLAGAIILSGNRYKKITPTISMKQQETPIEDVANILTKQREFSLVQSDKNISYSYLFVDGENDPNVSNIVGYFGSGAFAWYVPNWLVSNWKGGDFKSEGFSFTSKIKRGGSNFSDIIFEVSTSSEASNAETLYEKELAGVDSSDLIINEVLLNKHAQGMLSILIETSTRIYHVQKKTADKIKDAYYIDGNNKTVKITFEAGADIFSQFSDKIRDLVEGIGELREPQG